ncbi:MAG: phospholipid/cholesterol/gamma-HCH transport system substrate-binding protein [Solirubrobacteraceae bacterium]|jgi:phospholipid/cholesterol/gamma-HCH transport system substrate-binding protein|nr:phospholipid/cholesterol/gamma-HCH transport system substrate-binding protein [Solirubrobacteraceae bacterium]
MEGRGPVIGAVAGVAAIVLLVLVVVLFAGGSDYSVHARFTSASQIVKGNAVKVSGQAVGSVGDIRLTDDGQADVTLNISEDGYFPLRRGTRAIIRQSSLSGVANRYVDLQLGGARGAKIADGGLLATDSTEAAVDLDQIFNTFDPKTRAGTQKSIEFLRDFQAGNEDEANAALHYLNPALSSTSRLFAEVNRNKPDFERFIVQTSRLVTDVSAQDDVLSELVRNLAGTTSALTSHGNSLAQGIGLLPNVMRKANTTFVNLRASLDDLTPLVNDAKPVVRTKLRPLLTQLRPFARDAQPAVRDLSATVRRPGADNDLVELLRRQPALDQIATQTARRNGADRPGALPATVKALDGITPQLAFLRPYSTDLVGWFDDFSTSGAYDAMGNFSRAALELNGFSLGPLANLLPVPPELRNALLTAGVKTGRNNRCPGSVERRAPDGSNPYKPSPDFNCDASQVPIGP